jgi:NAD(P)-dependent dehydrogenase (short-subunit alcohol dehydrogenase family)
MRRGGVDSGVAAMAPEPTPDAIVLFGVARVLVTGSADGIGHVTARQLAEQGHAVTVHARNDERAATARARVPAAEAAVVGDLASLAAVRGIAEQVDALGRHDAVVHNAGVGYQWARRRETEDGLSEVFAVNVLAPYVLTALMARPDRIVIVSSGMHLGHRPDLGDLQWERRRWDGWGPYSETKLWDVVLAFAFARLWPDVRANAVDPGGVPTRMGGRGAPDDLELGGDTQAWLAAGGDDAATITGAYLYHRRREEAHPAASDPGVQDALLAACAELSGASLPAP